MRSLLLVRSNQATSRPIVVASRTLRLQLLLDRLRKDLAQLDSPLIEGVDVPDGALGERDVLVVGNERTESAWCDFLRKNGRRGPVPDKCLVRNQFLRAVLCADLVGSLSDHQGFGLSEEVGCQHALVLATVDGVVGLGSHEEVGGDELGALVQELEEAVLGIGGWLAEENSSRGVLHVVASAGDGLAVALHGKLLEVGRETVEVLVEWRDQVRLSTEEIAIPDAQEASDHRDVLLKRSVAEMVVHSMGTSEKLAEVIKADIKSHRETDCAPHGVTASNPRLEAEHVLLVDAKLRDLRLVGRQGDKVLRDMGGVLRSLEKPLLGGVRIGDGLSSGEGLGGDEEEGSLGIRLAERLSNVSAINVGDEV